MGFYKRKSISLRAFNILMAIIAFLISGFLIISLYMLTFKYNEMNKSTSEYIEWEKEAGELEEASDYLTEQVRYFVIIGAKEYLDNYFIEANDSKRREKALDSIKEKMANTEAYTNLNNAMNSSIALMDDEYHAMKLVILAHNYDLTIYPDVVNNYELSQDEINMSSSDKLEKAQDLVFGDSYKRAKKSISENVNNCVYSIEKMLTENITNTSNALRIIMIYQQAVILVLIFYLILLFLFIYISIVAPLKHGTELIKNNSFLSIEGVKEYRYFASEYNKIRKKDLENNEMLAYEAEHDKLTGIYNRTGYYAIYRKLELNKIAYILIDVDNFKMINDEYGHDIGDLVLKKVANVLFGVFNKDGNVFRIGGDEFTILFEDINEESVIKIRQKIHDANYALLDKDSDTPAVSLSVGVAFGDENDGCDSLFKKADIALYNTKNNGRNGVTFYDYMSE